MRSRVIISLILVFAIIITAVPVFAFEDFSSHWAARSIGILIGKGIVVGDENGNISPDKPITRAEFVTTINKAFNFVAESNENFPDVNLGEWYYNQFAKAKQAGIINGDEHGNVNPGANITRAEVSVIITNVLKLTSTNTVSTFTDNSLIPSWALASIIAMQENKLINGYPDGSVRAGSNITRAEGFTILVNVIESELLWQNTISMRSLTP
jgi:hypothetical protein